MSNLLTSPFDYHFEDLRNVAGYVAMSAFPIAAGFFAKDVLSRPETRESGIGGGDDVAYEQILGERSGRFKPTLRRYASVLLSSAGVAVAGVTLLGPVTEYEVTNPGSDAVVIADYSTSMQLTLDMDGGISRSQAALEAFTSVDAEAENVHIIAYGANSVTLPADTTLSEVQSAVEQSEVDPNGINLLGALEDAENIMAGAGDGAKNVIVLTDGIVEDEPAVGTVLARMAENGANIEVIVAGTDGGTFVTSEYQQEPFESSASTKPFEGLEGVETVQTTSIPEIASTVENGINHNTTSVKTRPVRTFLYAGMSLIFGGVFMSMLDKRKRKI